MATASARTKGPVGLLVAVITAEFAFALVGLSVMAGSHRFLPRPVTADVDAAFIPSSATAGIAAVLNPGVALAVATRPTSSSTPATAPPNPVDRVASTRLAKPPPALTAVARPTPTTLSTAGRAGWGCAAALAWLSSHSAPGYRFVCPGYAEGHQAMTCDNTAACPADQVIVIANPCPAAYMNEAHNSWILSGLAQGAIDPYGSC